MKKYNLLFSKDNYYRKRRHIVFWFCWYCISWLNFIYTDSRISLSNLLKIVSAEVFIKTVTEAFFFYSVIYFLIPKYFNAKKYLRFAAGMLFLFMLTYILTYLNNAYLFPYLYALAGALLDTQMLIYSFVIVVLKVPAACILGLSFIYLRNWYIKQKENEVLKRETIQAELQLLQAQIHPHFLFNTLNNIYSYALNNSPETSGLVLRLTDALNYMVNECEQQFVLLQKELKMITDYIELEEVRYGKRLRTEINITWSSKTNVIAPLLMIPFVENSFKHGTSKMLREPWIKLTIEEKEGTLYFSLMNSKPKDAISANGKTGIGLNNVKKRLALLYPDEHLLSIKSTENTFTVNMQAPLKKVAEEIASA